MQPEQHALTQHTAPAHTPKQYLYLLFCDDDVLPLDEWVFNTEAHPLPLPHGGAWIVAVA
jgi:hypothetical protein